MVLKLNKIYDITLFLFVFFQTYQHCHIADNNLMELGRDFQVSKLKGIEELIIDNNRIRYLTSRVFVVRN